MPYVQWGVVVTVGLMFVVVSTDPPLQFFVFAAQLVSLVLQIVSFKTEAF